MITTNKHKYLNWNKNNGLIPAIIQHSISGEILMLGYMNQESMSITENTGYVTFFSRSKNQLWTKGKVSNNKLNFTSWHPDCDNDALLIFVIPDGPTCHKNNTSCFNTAENNFSFLYKLEKIISTKKNSITSSQSSYNENLSSYTSRLYVSGIQRIAQKIGEEGVETALAAVSNNKKELIYEIADLIYHILVLLQYKSLNLYDVIQELRNRHNQSYHTKNLS